MQEYLANSLSLKDFALKHFSSPDPSRKPLCLELGQSLGVWLRSFHDWVALPEQVKLHDEMKLNQPMQQLKHMINYTTLRDTVANFPAILEDAKDIFEEMEKMSAEELKRPDLQGIHGDFWTGK